MTIVCTKCEARLHVDEAKVPARPFTIRCPKCNTSVDIAPPSPAPETTPNAMDDLLEERFDQPTPAPLFELETKSDAANVEVPAAERLAELLASLVQQPHASGSRKNLKIRPAWDPRKALVCASDEHRETVARGLVESGYQVFVAGDARQAVDRMRSDQLDVVVLDQRFDPVEQGPVFVTREVSILRPALRRRVFFVLLSSTLRTMDSHAAFLNNVNAIINVTEIRELPKLLDHRLAEYNELYREFNQALEVPAL